MSNKKNNDFKNMKNKLPRNMKIFLIISIIITTIYALQILLDVFLSNNDGTTIGPISMVLFYGIALPYLVGILIIYLIPILYKISKKEINKEIYKKDSFNFSRDKIYFRDIIENYSMPIIVYLYDMTFDSKKIILATLLKLQIMKKVKIGNNKISITDKKTALSDAEKYIVDSIIDNKIDIDFDGYLLKKVSDEANKNGLVILQNRNNTSTNKKVLFIILSIILYLCSFLIIMYYDMYLSIIIFFVIMPIFFLMYGFILLIKNSIKNTLKREVFEMTEKGKEIKLKLDGLRNYINDFSNLNDNDRKSLILWEDYLIYAYIFGINNKIVEDIENNINIKVEMGKVYFEE